MSISTSTIATLLIAGTAIGGSTAAVIISNSPVSADQQNQLQIIQPNTPGSTQQIVSGGKVTTIQPGAVKESVTSPIPTATPTSTPTTPSSPATPPPSFGGGGSNGSDEGQGGDDNNSGYGHNKHSNDDEGESEGSDG
jgi:hypothetical protein